MTLFVSLSGGMDSTAALGWARHNYDAEVRAVSFDYGQRHRRELEAASAVANYYGVSHGTLDLQGLLHGSALLGQGDVPHGHYAQDNMKATVVNGRNLLFASALIAATQPGDTVVLGVHAGDHPIYPDCRPEFVQAVAAAASAYDVSVVAPWVNLEKHQIIQTVPDAPYAMTWSCYEGGALHCGRCGTCVERAEAFHLAGVTDPTDYADGAYWREQVR